MEHLPRHYPHTRKEWEGIREQFTRLYQAERKKLSRIVETFAQQGFQAKEHHYKHYIRKWGLDKKNKKSDMIFAHHKIQQRRPKNTVFKIRGRRLTSQDIEHYWRRKPCGPEGLTCVASTPAGVEYRTPSPILEGTPKEAELLNDNLNSGTFSPDRNLDFDAFLHFTQGLLDARRSPSPRLLTSPEPLRTAEQALYYSNIVIQDILERQSRETDARTLSQKQDLVDEFQKRAFNAVAAVRYHHSPINVEAARLDLFQMIPVFREQYGPDMFATLLDVIALCRCRAHELQDTDSEPLGEQLVHKISLGYPETHPLPLLLKAVDQSSTDLLPLSTRVLRATNDALARVLGPQHSSTRNSLRTLWNVVKLTGNWHEALDVATEIYQLDLSIHESFGTDESLFNVFATQLLVFDCYKQLGCLAEAEELLSDGLKGCSRLLSPVDRDHFRSYYLAHQGLLRARRGQVAEGIECLNEALTLRTRLFGPTEHHVSWIAHNLQQLVARVHELECEA